MQETFESYEKIENDFIKKYCDNCINKDTYFCCISKTIDDKVKCTEYRRING